MTDSPGATSLARECLLLLNDRLAHQPGFVLLERESVDLVAREQGIAKAGAFWAGSYLLDGTVELSANAAAPCTVTLRLTPIGAGEAKTFSSKGLRSELPRLTGELVAQAASALKLHAAPVPDLKAEAQRYFDESRNFFAIGLPLHAYRAAATAAAFGLDSEEFIAWRLETAVQLIASQTEKLSLGSDFWQLRKSGWSESWIDQQMNGVEWLRQAEWIDLGLETVRLWQRLLLPALRADDPARAAALLARHDSIVGSAFAVFSSVSVAATMLDFHGAHLAIPHAVRETLEQALAFADAKPIHAANAGKIATQTAHLAGALYLDKASLVTAFTPLLVRDFATENTATRVAIRHALLSLDGETTCTFMAPASVPGGTPVLNSSDISTPQGIEARIALHEVLKRGTSAEDELVRTALDCLQAKNAQEQLALSEKMFGLFWTRRQLFVDAPSAISLFRQICALIRQQVANAPKFREQVTQTAQNQIFQKTPEMLDLRRKLFLLVSKSAEHPGPVSALLDRDFHPKDENAAEVAAAKRRAEQDDFETEMGIPATKPNPPPAAPKTTRPALPTTPTYAKYPPLKITHRWTAERTPHGRVEDLRIEGPAYDPEAEAVWLFGQFSDEKFVYTYVFEVSLPTLKTRAWPLPPVERTLSRGTSQQFDTIQVFPTREFLYLAKAEHFLAIGNRKTREWTLSPEVKPAGGFVRAGGDLFFLTHSGGARGLASLSLRDHAVTIHASNRRTPPQTPLDRTEIAAVALNASPDGLIEITTEPFDATNVAETMASVPKPRSLLIYDPAKQIWTGPKATEEGDKAANTFTPLTAAGTPRAYTRRPDTTVWTLQLSHEDMPKARVPLEFVGPEDRSPASDDAAMLGRKWYWVPQGYFIIDSPSFKGSVVYFLPQTELDAYLAAHEPDQDESHVAPAPTKRPAAK